MDIYFWNTSTGEIDKKSLIPHLINLHPDIAATMYRVNMLRFFYKQYDPIFLKENYLLALNNLNLRLKKRYDIKVDIKKISNYIKNNNIKITYGKLYDIIMCNLYLNKSIKHWAEKNQLMWREIKTFLMAWLQLSKDKKSLVRQKQK